MLLRHPDRRRAQGGGGGEPATPLPAPTRPRRRPPAATPPICSNVSEEKGKGRRCCGGVAGCWRRPHQRAPGRHPPPRPLVLPAEDAVRTSVLAWRWRDLWKSATGLRIGFGHEERSVDSLRHFVNHLLLLRKRDSCLHSCELRFHQRFLSEEERINLNLWIRHVVDREVQMLRLEIVDDDYGPDIGNLPLVSQHLKTLALINVRLYSHWNFTNCPNLEHLDIAESCFYLPPEISSKSLKHLSIRNCYFSCTGLHTLICTPSLVSLRLDGHFASVPVLASMPSLKEAFVRNHNNLDCSNENCISCADVFNDVPRDESDYKNTCFLLQGLSEAENFTLMCDNNGVIFHRDLEWCPTFNNLRTLLLNEWCFDPDFYVLDLILKHSPVLEKLNLQFCTKRPQHKVEIIGRYNQMERTATILKHLKEIEVKCDVVNKQVHKVLKFLGTFGISK